MVNTEREPIEINGNTEIEIKVVPYSRLKLTSIEVVGTTAKVQVQFEKLNPSQTLSRIGITWSTYRNPNLVTNTGGGMEEEDIEDLNLATGAREYTIINLKPGTKYFIRAFARTNNPGNYYNYSAQTEQQIN